MESNLFAFMALHLIEFMGIMMAIALLLRFVAYRNGQRDAYYFRSFSRLVEKEIEQQGLESRIENVDGWVDGVMRGVSQNLPDRAIRYGSITERQDQSTDSGGSNVRGPRRMTLVDFSDGKLSVVHAVRRQVDAFKSVHPPSFAEVTERVLNEDVRWRRMLRFVPVDTLARVLDILPGLFIIGGIFGTFIGIANALPAVATLDLTNVSGAAKTLSGFVASVAYSMNTSIAGIVCSVVLTTLNTVFPISATRNLVRKDLERCFEFVWHRIHGQKITFGEGQIVRYLAEILEVTKAQHRDGGDKVRKAS